MAFRPADLAGQTPDSTRLPGAGDRGEVPVEPPDTLPPISALGGFARSLVLPGWGQTALDRPVRGGIYFGLEAASLFMLFRAQSKLSAAQRAEPPDESLVDSRKGERERWIVLSVFWAFVSGLDAWVSAHFWDFEAEVQPPEEAGVGASLRIRVPVGP
ncbi:MAG: hypothetical protein ACE5HP_04270 [Gemmatimonadota bacterium]